MVKTIGEKLLKCTWNMAVNLEGEFMVCMNFKTITKANTEIEYQYLPLMSQWPK